MNPRAVLTRRYPAPWRVRTYAERYAADDDAGCERDARLYGGMISELYDANGELIASFELYSGDGDRIYLNDDEWRAIVTIVNGEAGA